MSSGIDFWLLIFNSDALEEGWMGFERVGIGEIEKGTSEVSMPLVVAKRHNDER
jgi:hypothetical protein